MHPGTHVGGYTSSDLLNALLLILKAYGHIG